MAKKFSGFFLVWSAITVPLLTLIAPTWFSIAGIGPCWPVLWLLPWAIKYGPFLGSFSGLCLGLILDGISLGGNVYSPVLVILGLWWGSIGLRGNFIDNSFNIGLLAFIGNFLLALFIGFHSFLDGTINSTLFQNWFFYSLLAQLIMTSLLAPILSSWILLILRKN